MSISQGIVHEVISPESMICRIFPRLNLTHLFYRLMAMAAVLFLASCGGGGGNSADNSGSNGGFTLLVSGLDLGNELTVMLNSGKEITINASGKYNLDSNISSIPSNALSSRESANALAAASGDYVSIVIQPLGQICSVTNASSSGAQVSCVNRPAAYAYVPTIDTFPPYVNIFDVNSGLIGIEEGVLTEYSEQSTPGYMVIHPSGRFMYGTTVGSTNLFEISTSGILSTIEPNIFGLSGIPNIMVTDRMGRFLFAAVGPYVLATFIDKKTGGIVGVQSIDSGGVNSLNMAAYPTGRFLYVITGNTLSVFSVNQTTAILSLVAQYTPPNLSYGLAISPSGKYLYVGASSDSSCFLQAYSVSSNDGTLSLSGEYCSDTISLAANIVVSPNEKYLYLLAGKKIVTFSIDANTGKLTQLSTYINAVNLGPLVIEPLNKYLYAINYDANSVSVFSINQSDGSLTVQNSISLSDSPYGIWFTPQKN